MCGFSTFGLTHVPLGRASSVFGMQLVMRNTRTVWAAASQGTGNGGTKRHGTKRKRNGHGLGGTVAERSTAKC